MIFSGKGAGDHKTHYRLSGNDRPSKWMRFLKSAHSKTPGYQISSKSDKFSLWSLLGGNSPPKNPSFLGKKCSYQNFKAIFEISALENPHIPKFIEIGQIFNFGDFFFGGGEGPSPKTKCFWPKKVRTKILMLFLDLAPSKGTRNRFTAKSDHN